MSIWVAAWLFSAILSAGVYVFCRRAAVPRLPSLILAASAFPAPLLQLISTSNSFVYALDMVTPLSMWCAFRSWRNCHVSARRPCVALLVAAGVCPLVVTSVFSDDRIGLLFDSVNLWRLGGAISILVIFGALPRAKEAAAEYWLCVFAWPAIVLSCAMFAQTYGGIDTNVFFHANGQQVPVGQDWEGSGSAVLGLFRAALGYISDLAICAYAVGRPRSVAVRWITLIGCCAAFLVCVECGSKTSLIIGLLLLAYRVWSTRGAYRVVYLVTSLVVVGAGISTLSSEAVLQSLPVSVARLVKYHGMESQDLSGRDEIWANATGAVVADPLIALGVTRKASMPLGLTSPYVPGMYHDEYLAVFMLGGFFSLSLYLLYLAILGWTLWHRRNGGWTRKLALTVFFVGLAQAVTVAHLQPGLIFCCSVSLICAAYGYGCPPRVITPQRAYLAFDGEWRANGCKADRLRA